MDFNQLKSFVAVAHHGQLTQAAESLHLSQPAVTAQIKALERHLNTELFTRNAQGMQLTHTGQALLPRAEAMLQEMHALDRFGERLQGYHFVSLNIGISDAVLPQKLARSLAHLARANTQVRVSLKPMNGGDILNAVRKKTLDGGFFIGEVPYRNVSELPLQTLSFVPVCAAFRLPESREAALHLFAEHPWLEYSAFAEAAKIQQKFWKHQHVRPQIVCECDHIPTALRLAADDLALCLVPKWCAQAAIACGVPLGIVDGWEIQEPLSFIFPNEYRQDAALGCLIDALAHHWQSPEPVVAAVAEAP